MPFEGPGRLNPKLGLDVDGLVADPFARVGVLPVLNARTDAGLDRQVRLPGLPYQPTCGASSAPSEVVEEDGEVGPEATSTGALHASDQADKTAPKARAGRPQTFSFPDTRRGTSETPTADNVEREGGRFSRKEPDLTEAVVRPPSVPFLGPLLVSATAVPSVLQGPAVDLTVARNALHEGSVA